MPPFETIWELIIQHQGEIFHTITNIAFTYQVAGNLFIRNGVQWNITRRDFEIVYNNLLQYAGPGDIPQRVNGRSYVWAVLNDPRILNH